MTDHTIRLHGASAISDTPATEEKTLDTTVSLDAVEEAPKGEEKPAKAPSVHVVVEGQIWQVKESGVAAPLFEHDVKKEAVKFATTYAKEKKTELFIHGANGKMQQRNSYGNDPKGRG